MWVQSIIFYPIFSGNQAYPIQKWWEGKTKNYEKIWNEVSMINNMKWGWFNVPVKVEQMNVYFFSDTTKMLYSIDYANESSIPSQYIISIKWPIMSHAYETQVKQYIFIA